MEALRETIENAFENRELLSDKKTQEAVSEVIALLDSGALRVAEPKDSGWQVNE